MDQSFKDNRSESSIGLVGENSQYRAKRQYHPHSAHEEKIKSVCPECNNQVFFLEAGFLCPTCGYSVETIFS